MTPPPNSITDTRFKPSMVLPEPPKSMGETLISLSNADIGHEEGKVLLKNIDFELRRGTKLILRGPNGAGKSTMMQALKGSLPLLAGKRSENEKLR